MSDDFLDATPETRAAVLNQKIDNLRTQRCDLLVTIELAELLPKSDVTREPIIDQTRRQIAAIEKVMHDCKRLLDATNETLALDDAEQNGNRATRRAASRTKANGSRSKKTPLRSVKP